MDFGCVFTISMNYVYRIKKTKKLIKRIMHDTSTLETNKKKIVKLWLCRKNATSKGHIKTSTWKWLLIFFKWIIIGTKISIILWNYLNWFKMFTKVIKIWDRHLFKKNSIGLFGFSMFCKRIRFQIISQWNSESSQKHHQFGNNCVAFKM